MEEVKSGSRWNKPLLISAFIVTVIACILALAYSRTDLSAAASSYEKNKKAAQDEGLLFTTADMEKLYAVPTADNAADLVAPIIMLPRKYKLDDPTKLTQAMIDKHGVEIESALKTLEEASKRKYLIFKRNYNNPMMVLFPEYAEAKSWVKFLTGAARLASQKNDPVAAKRYLNLAAYVSNSQDDEGILIGTLVRIACAMITETELKKLMPIHGKDPAWHDVFASTLKKLDEPYDSKVILKIEHWFAVASVDLIMKDPQSFSSLVGGGQAGAELRFGRYLPRFRVANLSRIHAAYASVAQNMPKDPYDLKGVEKAYSQMDMMNSTPGISNTLLQIVAPVYSNVSFSMSREIACRNVLLQSTELLKTGRDPRQGLPITGRYQLDNDGTKLRLKKLTKGWIVYSIGNDKTDDGGWDNSGAKGDWVVHLSAGTVPPPIDPKKKASPLTAPPPGAPAMAMPSRP